MDIIKTLHEELNISRSQAEAAVKLIDEGNTIPFIARYRKEATGSLNDEVLRDLDERLRYLRNLEEKKEQVHHRPRHPDGGKGGLPGEAADDHGVYGVVQLLEDVPKNQGEGQRHQLGRDGAPGQGGGLHSVSPHSFIR